MMIRFRFLFTLIAVVHKMIKIDLAENKILLFFFSRLDFEKNPDKRFEAASVNLLTG